MTKLGRNRERHERPALKRRFATIMLPLVAATVVSFAVAPAAQATPPERGYFSDSDSGTEPAGTTCEDFAVEFTQVEYGFYDVYFDSSGEVDRVVVHINYDATITGNGHTLIERDTFNRTFNADGTMRDAGLYAHIQGPGGVVLLDAGLIVYSDYDETVSYVRGPHPQLSGATFCPALAG